MVRLHLENLGLVLGTAFQDSCRRGEHRLENLNKEPGLVVVQSRKKKAEIWCADSVLYVGDIFKEDGT